MMSPGRDVQRPPHCAGRGGHRGGPERHKTSFRTHYWEEKRPEHSSLLKAGKLAHSQGNVGRAGLDIPVQVADDMGEEGEQSTAQKGRCVALIGGRGPGKGTFKR